MCLRSVSRARIGLALALALALGGAAEARAGSEAFGQCLANRGAVFYGASWCPVCAEQRRVLGSAMSQVAYVECSPDGERRSNTAECREAGIRRYPTWVFADGSRAAGRLSLRSLASRTGCSLAPPEEGGAADATAPGDADAQTGVRRRVEGGALIIEIP